MGKNIVHCGGAGTGGITKLCNNLSLAISMIGTSEAMALGSRLGMDPAKLASVMNTSTARFIHSHHFAQFNLSLIHIPSHQMLVV
jgi:3-hydroxyisobutyrate dehydrogenase